MRKNFAIMILLICGSLSAQRKPANLSVADFNNDKKFTKFMRSQNLCEKIKFVENNADNFVSLENKYKNTDKLLEDISTKTGYEINIVIANAKYFTSQNERKQTLLEDLKKIKLEAKCLCD